MIRSFLLVPIACVLVACPTEVAGPSVPTQPVVAPVTTNGTQTPADVTSNDLVAPPGADEVPADVKQRAIGALSEKGNAIKAEILNYMKRNTTSTGGLLSISDGEQKSANLKYIRTHDPVRHTPGKGYLALADFQDPNGHAEAFYNVIFWVNEKDGKYSVSSVVMQAYPEKRGGEWVRMEMFPINDKFATPLK